MKRKLCALLAVSALVGAVFAASASATGISEVRTTYTSGSPGPLQIVNWANVCDATSFHTADTTVGRSPASQYRNVTQNIGAYFDLFRWNGSSWVLARQDWSGWHTAWVGYSASFITGFENLPPGYYHLDVDYYWSANGTIIGRAYDKFFGTIYTKYTGVDDIGAGGNNSGGYTPLQANFCYVG
jgi:hypothetical protein